jgi:hypothetical protein
VQLRGTLVLAEIVALLDRQATGHHGVLVEGLRLAERAGANEFIWRLSYWIAQALKAAGDERGASTRLANAARVIREVASGLTPEHRLMYLNTPHARLLMAAADSATD